MKLSSIPSEAITKMKLIHSFSCQSSEQQKMIGKLEAQIGDFWEFLIEKDLVDEFYEWELLEDERISK